MRKVVISIITILFTLAVLLTVIPLIPLSKSTTEEYQTPKTKIILGNFISLLLPTKTATKGTQLNASDTLNIQVNATAGKNIDFYVNAVNSSNNKIMETYLVYPNITSINKDWIVPINSSYHFTFESNNLFSYEDVSLLVTRHWTETDYKDVTTEYQLLPFEASYIGIVLVISGFGILAYFKKYRK